MAKYKQLCMLCRKNMALVTSYKQRPICDACKKKDIDAEVTDPEFKKLFDIDPELYKKSDFLRRIKSYYLRFENLSERQVEAFKKVVEEVKAKEKAAPEEKK
jgi:hypothetical protein